MGKNPGIIKTIIVHTQKEKHAVFKEEIPAALKAVILHLWGQKRGLKIKSNNHQGFTKVLFGRKEKFTNSFYFFLMRSWGWEKLRFDNFPQSSKFWQKKLFFLITNFIKQNKNYQRAWSFSFTLSVGHTLFYYYCSLLASAWTLKTSLYKQHSRRFTTWFQLFSFC